MAGCKGEKVSAAEKVKDSVTSPSLIADSVVKKKDVPLVVDSIGKSYSTKKGDVDLAYSLFLPCVWSSTTGRFAPYLPLV